MATYRGSDSDPKEQFLYHAAGVAGFGSSSYIDAMLLRDDHDPHHADWDAAADSTLERRVYYVQNWRWDAVALLAENGRVLERAWHEPYGTPWGLPSADFTTSNTAANDDYGVPDGDADASDQGYFDTLHAASSTRADLTGSATSTDFAYGRPDGTVDGDDNTYYTDIKNAADTLGRGALSAEDGLRNRRGLSGYEWDPTHAKYHVRHRVLRPETGRWTRRDPAGYVGEQSLYAFAASKTIYFIDPDGQLPCRPPQCIMQWLSFRQWCCEEAKRRGLARTDYGGVICCKGMVVTCSWIAEHPDRPPCDGPGCQDGISIISRCIHAHEDVHAPHQECDDCDDVCRHSDPKSVTDRKGYAREECDAQCEELRCLDAAISGCDSLPGEARETCRSAVEWWIRKRKCIGISDKSKNPDGDGWCDYGYGGVPAGCEDVFNKWCK